MLKEGKAKMSTYRVWFFHQETPCVRDVETHSAQEAVNTVRNNPNVKITEVAKVVKNWK